MGGRRVLEEDGSPRQAVVERSNTTSSSESLTVTPPSILPQRTEFRGQWLHRAPEVCRMVSLAGPL